MGTDEFEHAAQQLLADRMDAVRTLRTRLEEAQRAKEAAAVADRDAAAAWTAATQAGWSAAELGKLGLSAPTTRRGGRPKSSSSSPRRRSSSRTKSAAQAPPVEPVEEATA